MFFLNLSINWYRRIKQQLDSWSPLAASQIIAQPCLRPIISHGGYAVNGMKRAVVWANNSKLTGKFELIDALNNVQHPHAQAVVFTGDLIEKGNHIWGGNNYIADFSDFKKEGLYFVRLKIKETREVNDSYVFSIKRNFYFDLAKKAAKWFYFQRCGIEVPGFHKACHMQDTIIKTDGTKVDVSGGWHDAGDYGKWIVGFNPADISMMAGIGKGPGCYHHRYCFMKGCEHGIVPGGILNGIMPGNGGIIEIGDITKNFIIAELPPEYPIIDTGVWGWTFAYLTNEYWTRNNSWFVLGAMQIEKAMRELK